MKINELTEQESLHYCTKDEDHFFDRKAYGISGEKIQKIVVAFANADGGEVIVGITDVSEHSDAKERWRGRESTEEYNSVIQAISELVPSVDFRFDFLTRKNESRNYVLRLKINKGLALHETAAKKVFIRIGAQSQQLTAPIKILELTHAKGIRSEEDSLVPNASIDDLYSSKLLRLFLDELPIKVSDPLAFLVKEQLIDKNDWTPKVASLLLFSENPSSILPKQCAIKIVRYDTSEDDIDRDALTDDIQSIEKPLYQQIEESFHVIKSYIAKSKVWTLNGQRECEYPDETLWEVLVNSVIHRDYSISDNVLISVFNNRIEFQSPGRFPGFVTADNILNNRFSRNSKIVRLLSKYRNSPNKDLGEGMNTAFQKMKSSGLKQPEIVEDGNYVKVILRYASNIDHEKLVTDFIRKFGEISNRQARDLTGLETPEKVTYLFTKLREKGLIQRKNASTGVKSTWIIA